MQKRIRVKKKRSFIRRNRDLLLFLACVLACLMTFAYTNLPINTVRVVPPPTPEDAFALLPVEGLQPDEEVRVVYPYSVIPGGVRNSEELIAHIATDKVVSEHYKNFKVSKARMVKAEKTRMMYVSYRMNDEVYWTEKKVRIPEGELLVSDGECEARARCGNMVSASQQEPVAEEDPIIETFDFPQLARLMPPKLSPLPMISMQWDPIPPVFPSVYPRVQSPRLTSRQFRPLFSMRGSDVVVPEPGTFTLLMTGLAAFFGFRFFRKK